MCCVRLVEMWRKLDGGRSSRSQSQLIDLFLCSFIIHQLGDNCYS